MLCWGHRTCDYHPDHRYTGVLVEDAAVLVAAPFFVTACRLYPQSGNLVT